MTGQVDALVVGVGAVGSGYDQMRARDAPPLSHAGAYAAHPEARLVAGVDVDPGARAAFTSRWDVPAYSSLAEALRNHAPQVASVCTPVTARRDTITALLEGGVRAVWAEKPLAETSAAAQAIVALCEASDAGLLVNFLRRLDPVHRHVAEQLAELGGARHIDVRYSGSLSAYATHGVDLARWWGGEVASVTAVAVTDREPIVALELAGGATAVLTQVLLAPAELFEVDVFARGTRFALAGLGERVIPLRAAPSRLFRSVELLSGEAPDDRSGLDAAMMCGVSALVDHLRTGARMPSTGADAVAALLVQEAIERSLASGGRVDLGGMP